MIVLTNANNFATKFEIIYPDQFLSTGSALPGAGPHGVMDELPGDQNFHLSSGPRPVIHLALPGDHLFQLPLFETTLLTWTLSCLKVMPHCYIHCLVTAGESSFPHQDPSTRLALALDHDP